MPTLNLETKDKAQEVIKEYLENSASDVLAEKINDGVIIEKDGKRFINKKTLDGFMKYACAEARKQAEKGKNNACIEDSVVFGWAVHYFEENSIEGTLYNEDGTEYKPSAPKQSAPINPTLPKPQPKPQMSLFELMDERKKTAEPVKETSKDEPKQPDENINDEISEEEQQEILAELVAEEEQKSAGSPMYRQYTDIQRKYPDSIIAYRLGDFYEVFGENAAKIAEELDLTLTGRNCGLDERVPMVGFPYHVAETYFNKLTDCGYTVVVAESDKCVELLPKIQIEPEKHWVSDTVYVDNDGVMHEIEETPTCYESNSLCILQEFFSEELILR